MTLRRSAATAVLGAALLLAPATTSASALPHLQGVRADDPAPAAPAGIQASYDVDTQTTTVGWDPNTEGDLAGYRLYRRLAETDAWALVSGAAPLTATSTTDPLPATGDTYAYSVRAVDLAGHESEPDGNDWYLSTPDVSPPGVPADLTAQGTTAGNIVRWGASSDHVDHYEVWAAPGGQQDEDGPDSVYGTGFTDAGAAQGVSVTYTVEAVDASGQRSGVSAPVTVTRPVPGTAPKPSWLMAQHLGNKVRISWDVGSQGMGQSYRVYAQYPDPSAWSLLKTAYPAAGMVDVPAVTSYFYVVSVDDDGRESSPAFVTAG